MKVTQTAKGQGRTFRSFEGWGRVGRGEARVKEQSCGEDVVCYYDGRNIDRSQREDQSRKEDRSPDMKYEFYPEGSGEPWKDLRGGYIW